MSGTPSNDSRQTSQQQSTLSPRRAQSARSPTSPYVASPRSATTQGSGPSLWSPTSARTDGTGASSQVPSPTSPGGWNNQLQDLFDDIMGQLDAMMDQNNGGADGGGGHE
ncbi:hypothetical protein IAR50_002564 [Cryptococcus sp. DSM 104548]